jgi:WD40 repeat protein
MADDADDDDEAVGISDQDVISSTPITLNGHTASVNSLCISDDGERFFSGSGDRSIVIWNLRSNREEAMRKICIHEGGILDLCCHGDFLVSASSDATVRIFDLGRNEQVGYLKGHQGVVSCVGVVPGDGSLGEGFDVVSGGYDGTVRYWRCREDGEWEARVIWSSISLGVEEDDGNGSSAVGEVKDKTLMISDLEVGDGKVFVARFRAGIEIVDIQSRTRVT